MKSIIQFFIIIGFTLLAFSGAQAGPYDPGRPAPYPDPNRPAPYPNPNYGSYYNWARAQNGYGYCYEFTNDGRVLNGGQPVSDYLCEQVSPPYYAWGRAQNGYTYCYRFVNGMPMHDGQPVDNAFCR
jgi:hypothetical protein